MPVTREDVLLLIADGAEGPYPLDAIRMMKGCFLAAQRGRAEWRDLFSFEPYDYGPFDPSVYRARDALVARGLLEASTTGQHEACVITDLGHAEAERLAGDMGAAAAGWLRSLGKYVTSRSFSQLLKEVYAAFPEYAERSVMLR